jgi:hypothetical protein
MLSCCCLPCDLIDFRAGTCSKSHADRSGVGRPAAILDRHSPTWERLAFTCPDQLTLKLNSIMFLIAIFSLSSIIRKDELGKCWSGNLPLDPKFEGPWPQKLLQDRKLHTQKYHFPQLPKWFKSTLVPIQGCR